MRRVGQVRRRDQNETAIVEALRYVGCTVFRISEPGAPDLFVSYKGVWTPLEVKSAKGRLTELQKVQPGKVAVVRTVEDALAAIGVEVTG